MLKTVSSITNAIGALNYKGTWNASTNTPTITSGVGVKGDYYVVSVNGTTTIDGISNWGVGDWITYNGGAWQRVEGGADLNGVNLEVTGTTNLAALTASTALALDASKNVVSVTNTGTGNNALADKPSFVSTIGVGGATPAASGAGITFPATVSLSTDPNTLDDYEEGTWTPTLTNVTVGNGFFDNARYVKIGQQVFVTFNFFFGSTTTVATGTVDISGLPFARDGNGTGSAWLFDATGGGYTLPAVLASSTSSNFRIARGITAGTDQITNALPFVWAVDDRINFAGVYRTIV
jgi:hypothetical protein